MSKEFLFVAIYRKPGKKPTVVVRRESFENIAEAENFAKGFFGGPFDEEKGLSRVDISIVHRTLNFDSKAKLKAGGGPDRKSAPRTSPAKPKKTGCNNVR